MMKDPLFIGENNKNINIYERYFPVSKNIDMISWLCFYEKSNYDDADNLYKTLNKASKGFGIQIFEPEWIEMPDRSSPKIWSDTADDYIGKGKDKYSFAIFLIGQKDKNGKLYSHLKKHSLCTNGYVSQVIKVSSLQKRGVMSICSKILLQVNAKLGGYSYQIKNINKDKKSLMAIGIDSSYIKRKGRGIAMVATIDDSFNNFYNKEEIINEDDEKNIKKLEFCVRSFIEEAIEVYKSKNIVEPQGIIIYRQGVSLKEKEYLEIEIEKIDEFCNFKNIDYYYILVNTKTTLKFFELKEKKRNKYKVDIFYNNPQPGLLIIDGVTNKR